MKRRPFGLWAEVPHPFVSIRRDGKEVYRTELGSSKKSRTREAILARLARAIPECDSLLEQNE
ncbi:MAG: hypothetical protein JST04_06265 [Bdellovibrionales bacterium]|nr:hypothetical protein [Bdellovibrionales bacterium]